MDKPDICPDIVARWLESEALATALGNRIVNTVGTGTITLDFTTTYSHPELEPGDPILIPTDRFVAKDPRAARYLRGRLWMYAIVTAVHGVMGQTFTAWVRSYSDIFASASSVDRDGYILRHRAKVYDSGASQSLPDKGYIELTWDSEDHDSGSVHSTVGDTERLVAPATGSYVCAGKLAFENLAGVVTINVFDSTPVHHWEVILPKNAETEGDVEWSFPIELVAGDYLLVGVDGDAAAGSVDILTGDVGTSFFSLTRIK